MDLGKISHLDDIPLTAQSIQPRRRISLTKNSKGYTYDVTVECYGDDPDYILIEIERLRLALELRYGTNAAA